MARGCPEAGSNLAATWGALTLCACLTGCGSPVDVTGVVFEFLDRASQHDVDGALDLLGDDPVLELPDAPPLHGSGMIREWLVWDSVVGGYWIPGSMRQSGDTVRIDALEVQNHWLLILGLPGVTYGEGTRFVVGRDGIRAIRLAPLQPASRDLLEERLGDVLAWARHEYPERLGRIRRDGAFVFRSRTATDWLSLLREWRTGRR